MKNMMDFLNYVLPITSKIQNVSTNYTGIGNALGSVMDIVSGSIDISYRLVEYIYKTSEKPANIGIGTYNKYISGQLAMINKHSNFASNLE